MALPMTSAPLRPGRNQFFPIGDISVINHIRLDAYDAVSARNSEEVFQDLYEFLVLAQNGLVVAEQKERLPISGATMRYLVSKDPTARPFYGLTDYGALIRFDSVFDKKNQSIIAGEKRLITGVDTALTADANTFLIEAVKHRLADMPRVREQSDAPGIKVHFGKVQDKRIFASESALIIVQRLLPNKNALTTAASDTALLFEIQPIFDDLKHIWDLFQSDTGILVPTPTPAGTAAAVATSQARPGSAAGANNPLSATNENSTAPAVASIPYFETPGATGTPGPGLPTVPPVRTTPGGGGAGHQPNSWEAQLDTLGAIVRYPQANPIVSAQGATIDEASGELSEAPLHFTILHSEMPMPVQISSASPSILTLEFVSGPAMCPSLNDCMLAEGEVLEVKAKYVPPALNPGDKASSTYLMNVTIGNPGPGTGPRVARNGLGGIWQTGITVNFVKRPKVYIVNKQGDGQTADTGYSATSLGSRIFDLGTYTNNPSGSDTSITLRFGIRNPSVQSYKMHIISVTGPNAQIILKPGIDNSLVDSWSENAVIVTKIDPKGAVRTFNLTWNGVIQSAVPGSPEHYFVIQGSITFNGPIQIGDIKPTDDNAFKIKFSSELGEDPDLAQMTSWPIRDVNTGQEWAHVFGWPVPAFEKVGVVPPSVKAPPINGTIGNFIFVPYTSTTDNQKVLINDTPTDAPQRRIYLSGASLAFDGPDRDKLNGLNFQASSAGDPCNQNPQIPHFWPSNTTYNWTPKRPISYGSQSCMGNLTDMGGAWGYMKIDPVCVPAQGWKAAREANFNTVRSNPADLLGRSAGEEMPPAVILPGDGIVCRFWKEDGAAPSGPKNRITMQASIVVTHASYRWAGGQAAFLELNNPIVLPIQDKLSMDVPISSDQNVNSYLPEKVCMAESTIHFNRSGDHIAAEVIDTKVRLGYSQGELSVYDPLFPTYFQLLVNDGTDVNVYPVRTSEIATNEIPDELKALVKNGMLPRDETVVRYLVPQSTNNKVVIIPVPEFVAEGKADAAPLTVTVPTDRSACDQPVRAAGEKLVGDNDSCAAGLVPFGDDRICKVCASITCEMPEAYDVCPTTCIPSNANCPAGYVLEPYGCREETSDDK